ncbi:MAG: 16S rRNA (cytosine(1402)-N(4))-methyltransferase RsmH [Eubacteriales bacterium]
MEFKHTAVLYDQVIDNLKIIPDGVYVDGTLGGGGHAGGICQQLSENGTLVGIDRDQAALDAASNNLKDYKCKKYFLKGNYSSIKDLLKQEDIKQVNGIILDLGVSSFQLDNSARGFSYMNDGPLDMRMDSDSDRNADQIVNEYSEDELKNIIRDYGEEKWASRIASFIVKARAKGPISTTHELVEIIKAAIPAGARREGPHPAKRTFQAIRIEVNDELNQLEKAVDEMIDVLSPQGRLCIITFHSLEDRIVKDRFNNRANPCTCPKEFPFCICGKVADVKKISTKPILPTEKEIDENPRSRSAKLRVLAKI